MPDQPDLVSHLNLEFQGYLLDKDRTEEEFVEWIKLIMDELDERFPDNPYEFVTWAT